MRKYIVALALPQYKQLTVGSLSNATCPPIFMQLTGQNNGKIACPALVLPNHIAVCCYLGVCGVRRLAVPGHRFGHNVKRGSSNFGRHRDEDSNVGRSHGSIPTNRHGKSKFGGS